MSMVRADEAARTVVDAFIRRTAPFARLGVTTRPADRSGRWDYWWQAHLIDCLVDATTRGSGVVDPGLIAEVLTGVWLRNGLRYRNRYFDDMAWLSLAAQRAGSHRVRLARRLRSGISLDFGGGSFWRTDRQFKAAAATGPIALFLARSGDRRTASDLVDWLLDVLLDDRGLIRDGVRMGAEGPEIDPLVFTYNQGPALGALLELGGKERLAAAGSLVHAVGAHLVRGRSRILVTHASGDGGLFTGILTRYLALAARDGRLDGGTRRLAADLVLDTAANLWDGRQLRDWRGATYATFPTDTASGHPNHPAVVELSTQLQAWMALEAAATLA